MYFIAICYVLIAGIAMINDRDRLDEPKSLIMIFGWLILANIWLVGSLLECK